MQYATPHAPTDHFLAEKFVQLAIQAAPPVKISLFAHPALPQRTCTKENATLYALTLPLLILPNRFVRAVPPVVQLAHLYQFARPVQQNILLKTVNVC